ncbi:MAG: GGDEF domain-containing protein [Clostridiales bacterium]|nr:GGDEF domain-containing protein [Clostridiales bacterium]
MLKNRKNKERDSLESVSNILSDYLRKVLYEPEAASLDVSALPESFHGLGNELKSLHASLKHLTWQTEQIAQGDYSQQIDFMDAFSVAFNAMVAQLAERHQILEERANRDCFTKIYNRAFAMSAFEQYLNEEKRFVLIFTDLDGLKYVNDVFGHQEGDLYILSAAKHLTSFSPDALVSRIGGDEFLLLVPNIGYDEAHAKMKELCVQLENDESLDGKDYRYRMSFGIAAVEPGNTLSASDLLSLADERMYENKRERKRAAKGVK